MVTFPFSTITGTSRPPFECSSIRCMAALSCVTSKYWTGTFRLPYSSRAARVYGQVSFPKISTGSAIAFLLNLFRRSPPKRVPGDCHAKDHRPVRHMARQRTAERWNRGAHFGYTSTMIGARHPSASRVISSP